MQMAALSVARSMIKGEMMQRIFFKRMALVTLVFLLFGCASGKTYHLYEGNLRPLSEIAAIKPWLEKTFMPMNILNVWPASIDGKPTEPYRGELPSYFVPPGEHKIVIGFNWSDGKRRLGGEDPIEMLFTAKAGHLYLTKASMPIIMAEDQAKISFWIEDANTGEIVAGTRLSTK